MLASLTLYTAHSACRNRPWLLAFLNVFVLLVVFCTLERYEEKIPNWKLKINKTLSLNMTEKDKNKQNLKSGKKSTEQIVVVFFPFKRMSSFKSES